MYWFNGQAGLVGIGTDTPNAKLDVNGNSILHGKVVIGTQQLTANSLHYADALLTVSGKVVMQSAFATVSNWADYVFNENYILPKLNEVENYYKTNKHLSGIPSEKEVIENGVDLAEMNKLLLKKIEELTLYVVEQNKRIEKLEKVQKK
ncbi:MAG: hypothetical protein A3F72_12155 [Bacteroidetes bacterium RIFCSPLOWO2_12_FULL_35_15]|nr:MAG: hypothetical protein A3F72_12155 [Bacteroidetes bacterium RIFCSPLOWO2_12_FULL_35_15]